MKKTLGYGYRLSSESLFKALSYYTENTLHKSKKEVEKQIRDDKNVHEIIDKKCKTKIFKVTVEEQ